MKWKRSLVLSMLFILFSLSLLLPVVSAQAAASSSELANKNINRNDLSLVSLKGDWQFYWQQALTPEDFANDTTTPAKQLTGATINVPFSWEGQNLGQEINDGQPLPRYGFATYRKQLTIETEQVGTNMALLLENVGSAHRVWVNGELVGELGNVSTTDKDSETPWIRLNLVEFTPQTEQVDIIVQASNHSFRESGILGDAKIGAANAVSLYVFKKYVLQDLLFICMFLIIGLYHIFIYFISKRTIDLLLLGILCILIGLRAMLLNKFIFVSLIPDFSWTTIMHLQFVVKFMVLLCYISLFRSLYREDVHPLAHRISYALGLLMTLYVVMVPPSHFTATMPVQSLVMVLILGYYAIYVGYLTLRRKREGAWLNMTGALVVIVAVIHDTFYFMGNVETLQLVPFSLLIHLLLQSATISYRYAQTQRRNEQLAGQLHQLNVELEETIAERTEELRRKNEELTKQGEQRSQLMANIAHDLGSPLIGMQNHIKLMQRDLVTVQNGDVKKGHVLSQMMSGLIYMKRMVDDLFELSRLEARHSDFQFVQIAVSELWAGIQDVFDERHEQGEIAVEYGEVLASPESRQWLLEVDLQSIYRVVHNYLDNAIKFSGQRPCQVRVNCYLSQQEAGQAKQAEQVGPVELIFELVDFGRGIAEEEVPHIFERFYRGKVRLQGSGLGLSIVREIIRQHGGAVGVASVYGQGSTFSFRLPLVRAKEE